MQIRRFSWLAPILAVMFTGALYGCMNLDRQRPPEEYGFLKTDYLSSLSGIYQNAVPSTASGVVVTLVLYADGACLYAEKQIGALARPIAISTGRWDHSDFPKHLRLHLKQITGAQWVMEFDAVSGELNYRGKDLRLRGLSLRRQAAMGAS